VLVIHAPQAFASISNVPMLVAQPIPPLGRKTGCANLNA
jgi:hypothetical protein